MSEAITYKDLKISLCDIVYMESLDIEESVNNHAKITFTAVLKDKIKEEIIHEIGDYVTVVALVGEATKDEVKTIFTGKISDISMVTEGDIYKLKVKAFDLTYDMDRIRMKKSFQDTSITHKDIVADRMKSYTGSDFIVTFNNEATKELIVQYNETDWEFIRRIASMYNEGVYSQPGYEGIRIYVGVPNIKFEGKLNETNYIVEKDIQDLNRVVRNSGLKILDSDVVTYVVKENEYISLGTRVRFKEQDFNIISVRRTLESGLLVNEYRFRKRNGHKCKRMYNKRITGASRNATVLEIKRDKLKVHLSIDKSQDKGKAYWFPFSTVAASSDGSGWYGMPKIGDIVRVYFPTERESEVYTMINSGAHIPETSIVDNLDKPVGNVNGNKGVASGSSTTASPAPTASPTPEPPKDPKGDPKNKNITIPNGESINVTASGTQVFTSGGKAMMIVDMDGTVTIDGSKNIFVGAVEEISLRSEKELKITGSQSVTLKSDKAGTININPGGVITVDGEEIIEN